MDTGGSRATVLVVDDEHAVADLHAYWLRPEYDVLVEYGGEAALEAVDDSVDVVLLDRRMPDVDGDEVLVAIRDRGYDCRVGMVTAVPPDVDVLDLGFDDYLCKPVDREGLVGAVHRLEEYDAYPSLHAELTSKLVRRNVLRTEHSRRELESDPSFAALEADIDRLQERAAARRGEGESVPARRPRAEETLALRSP